MMKMMHTPRKTTHEDVRPLCYNGGNSTNSQENPKKNWRNNFRILAYLWFFHAVSQDNFFHYRVSCTSIFFFAEMCCQPILVEPLNYRVLAQNVVLVANLPDLTSVIMEFISNSHSRQETFHLRKVVFCASSTDVSSVFSSP